jgi:vacuolar-type H+-ATPase subunit C/Vma6
VNTVWADVGARARGLGSRLVGGDTMRDLARSRDMASLARALERAAPEFTPDDPPTPAGIELASRRAVAARLAILIRWCGDRAPQLAPVFDEEDHRSIRAALRGAVAGAPPEERRAGLIPTPSLGERALEELTRQPTPAAVAALLATWEHPLVNAILMEARREQPDLYLLESALDAAFAARAERAAKQGDAALKDFVRIAAVAQRAWTALLSPEPEKDLASLRHELPGTPLARALASGTPHAETIERAALETQLIAQRRHGRTEPLGLGPVLYFLVRLRAEMRDLGRIAWGVALDAPRAMLAGGVISP